jgi:hypothetical protein
VARKLRVEAAAREELAESVVYIDNQDPGLGEELAAEVTALLDVLLQRPETFPVLGVWSGHEVRSALARRFKYRVVFVVRPQTVWVISIGRQRRGPHWASRLKASPPD